VDLAFAGEEAVTEQLLRALEPTTLVEVSVVRDEHIPHELRVAEQIQRLGA